FNHVQAQKQIAPAIRPMTTPCQGSTKPDAGVMAPRPAMAPVITPSTDGFPRVHHSRNIQVSAPVEAARCVAVIAKAARAAGPGPRAAVEAEPAAREQARADPRQRQVVGCEIVRAVAVAFAEHVSRDQTGNARVEVDDGAAGKIENADTCEKAAAPHPVR